MPEASSPEILCVGEVLWDVFPTDRFLGGAPLNVAYHLHALGRDAAIASRVGSDPLGTETRQHLRQTGLDDRFVQTDPDLPTGRVNVTLIDAHTPRYEIEQPSAWDEIEATPQLVEAARGARVIVFGSLAQRNHTTRHTVRTLLTATKGLRVFDANLREPFVRREVIGSRLRHADLLKINDQELETFKDWFDLPAGDAEAASVLSERYELRGVCVTRGAKGAALWLDGAWHEHPGYRVTAVDPVGAGDAFLAGLIDRLLAGDSAAAALEAAGALGAFVAGRPSACPPHDSAAIAAIRGG